eukprot:3237117-Prymnesium_polylepis.1
MVSDAPGGHRLVRLAGLRIHVQLFAPRVVPGLLSLFVSAACFSSAGVLCSGHAFVRAGEGPMVPSPWWSVVLRRRVR